jgi:hypothetical protein
MRKNFVMMLGLAGLLAAVAPAWAHHAFAAEFDAQKPVKLKGTVAKVEFINPHSWIHMDVKEADGKVTRHQGSRDAANFAGDRSAGRPHSAKAAGRRWTYARLRQAS